VKQKGALKGGWGGLITQISGKFNYIKMKINNKKISL
jgi:hypothetical protein